MKLLINEFIKDYKKKTTLLYFVIMFGLIILIEYVSKFSYGENLPDYTLVIDNSFMIVINIAIIFSMIIFANNLSQEYSKGTIKFLYSKPKSRSAVLTAKIFVAIINTIFMTIVGFIFDLFIQKYLVYKNGFDFYGLLTQKMPDGYFGRLLWQQLGITFLVMLVYIIFFISLVLLICTWVKTQILSLVALMVMILGQNIVSALSAWVATKFSAAKYIFTNVYLIVNYYNSELTQSSVKEFYKLNNTELFLMTLCYIVLFMGISYVINARRDVTLD
ncbi:ABC transporter permease subunit [Gemella sp. GH3]|uniref:ABC transporter permease n=1 Tax=unclassified Gemella TaxID=2624949 RepID=UPI0015D058DD|nr:MULTISPECIES: ABC transporter permease subunit [unclassified Gemella]MBF0713279.1 ABC transporter permease subunit [Gemella sp. GH3.1]NYS50231.1 ABC transporter permease subunit [Gemella sp. GH3]